MRAILLAAGQGSRLRPLTDDRPKCMVEVGGRPLLHHQLDALRSAGVEDIVVVRGFRRVRIEAPGIRTLDNPRWATTNMVESLRCACSQLEGSILVAYTDLLYHPRVIQAARSASADIGVVIDRDWRELWQKRMDDPLADAETCRLAPDGRILDLGRRPSHLEEIEAQYVGIVRLSPAGCERVRDMLDDAFRSDGDGSAVFGSGRTLARAQMTDLLMGLIRDGAPVHAIPIHGGWTEIDTLRDLEVAEELLAAGAFTPHPAGEAARRDALAVAGATRGNGAAAGAAPGGAPAASGTASPRSRPKEPR